MILVDTSVLIDYLKGHEIQKTTLLDAVIRRSLPVGIEAQHLERNLDLQPHAHVVIGINLLFLRTRPRPDRQRSGQFPEL